MQNFPDSMPYMMLRIYTFEPHFNLPTKRYSLITSMKHILLQNDIEEMHQLCYYSILFKVRLRPTFFIHL